MAHQLRSLKFHVSFVLFPLVEGIHKRRQEFVKCIRHVIHS